MSVKFATIKEINACQLYAYFKFVKVDGVYRFASTDVNFMLDHSSMISPEERSLVEGAGTIHIGNGKWNIETTHSTTIKNIGVKKNFVTPEISGELEKMIAFEYDCCL